MANVLVPEIPAPGFSFDLFQRNVMLEKKGFVAPKGVKTGTTIAGIIYKDGVILGADTRATEGTIVSDKESEKIHYLANNIYCCGAGTAADTSSTTKMISSQLELHRLSTGRVPRVITASHMLKQMLFRYQGYISAALVLGGVDVTGPHLCCIYPHGSCDYLQYTSMGSGSLAAMSVFESRWKPGLNEEDAIALVVDAIRAGVFNDLGSGNSVDICVLRNDYTKNYIRPYELACTKGVKQGSYRYKKGTTAVLTKTVRPIIVEDESVRSTEQELMDVA